MISMENIESIRQVVATVFLSVFFHFSLFSGS